MLHFIGLEAYSIDNLAVFGQFLARFSLFFEKINSQVYFRTKNEPLS